MKKHVSLFLALLMMFSALFALPAEAAQIQDEQTNDNTHIASLSERFAAPRATDPDVGTNAVVIPGTGGGCAHTYNTVRYNGNYHKRVCRKCGSYYLVAHTFNLSMTATTHSKYCSVCGYSTTSTHSFKYTYTESTHKRYCTVCNYSISAAHNLKPKIKNNDSSYHYQTCVCGYSKLEKHSGGYCYHDEFYDDYKCTICGYLLDEQILHDMAYLGLGIIDGKPFHHFYCKNCWTDFDFE